MGSSARGIISFVNVEKAQPAICFLCVVSPIGVIIIQRRRIIQHRRKRMLHLVLGYQRMKLLVPQHQKRIQRRHKKAQPQCACKQQPQTGPHPRGIKAPHRSQQQRYTGRQRPELLRGEMEEGPVFGVAESR